MATADAADPCGLDCVVEENGDAGWQVFGRAAVGAVGDPMSRQISGRFEGADREAEDPKSRQISGEPKSRQRSGRPDEQTEKRKTRRVDNRGQSSTIVANRAQSRTIERHIII